GIKIDSHSKDDLRLLYWGLGRHIGTAVSQSKDGDILGDVRNVGVDIHSPQGRGYKSNQRLNFHTDSADLGGLVVLSVAKTGRVSRVDMLVGPQQGSAAPRPGPAGVVLPAFLWERERAGPAAGAALLGAADLQRAGRQVRLPLHPRPDRQRPALPRSAAFHARADRGARPARRCHQ